MTFGGVFVDIRLRVSYKSVEAGEVVAINAGTSVEVEKYDMCQIGLFIIRHRQFKGSVCRSLDGGVLQLAFNFRA